jgi:hypothetical protein
MRPTKDRLALAASRHTAHYVKVLLRCRERYDTGKDRVAAALERFVEERINIEHAQLDGGPIQLARRSRCRDGFAVSLVVRPGHHVGECLQFAEIRCWRLL